MLQVQQLTADHGKKWKAKEFGYNPRVAEKKGVIVKRIKEYIQSYQCDAQQVRQAEYFSLGSLCRYGFHMQGSEAKAALTLTLRLIDPGEHEHVVYRLLVCKDVIPQHTADMLGPLVSMASVPSRPTTSPDSAGKQELVQAIQRLEREQQTSGLPLSRFIDSIRPGKGKRKGRDDDGDEAADDGHHSAHQHDPHAALLQVRPQRIPWASQARRCRCCGHHGLTKQGAACLSAAGVRRTHLLVWSGAASPD